MSLVELYTYRAVVNRIYDGDTITVDIDLGFGIVMKDQVIRLLGIDTPEIRGEERPQGIMSRSFVEQRIPVGTRIMIKTIKDKKEKYGRYLGTIFYGETLANLNEELLASGHADVYE